MFVSKATYLIENHFLRSSAILRGKEINHPLLFL